MMMMVSKRPPKYSCTTCNKQFRHKGQHFRHVMHCKGRGATQKQFIDIRTEYPQPQYSYLEYDYSNPIPSGHRHLRTGLPFAADPLRRKIPVKMLPESMPSLGLQLPRLSKYKNQAI